VNRRFLYGAACFSILKALPAFAQTIQPSCDFPGQVKSGCSFPETAIAQKVTSQTGHESLEGIQTDFEMSYKFECNSFDLGIRFVAGNITLPVLSTRNNETRTFQFRGAESDLMLQDIELQQKTTLHADLIGECAIQIENVKAKPAAQDLERINNGQEKLIKRIRSKMQDFKSFAELINVADIDSNRLASAQKWLQILFIDPVLFNEDLDFRTDLLDIKGMLKPAEKRTAKVNDLLDSNVELNNAIQTWIKINEVIAAKEAGNNQNVSIESISKFARKQWAKVTDEAQTLISEGYAVSEFMNEWKHILKAEQIELNEQLKLEIENSCKTEKAKEQITQCQNI
jgi:hypothetical protein